MAKTWSDLISIGDQHTFTINGSQYICDGIVRQKTFYPLSWDEDMLHTSRNSRYIDYVTTVFKNNVSIERVATERKIDLQNIDVFFD